MANREKFTPERRAKFLQNLAETANVSAAARAVRMARQYLYELRDADADFAKAWDAAVVLGTEALEDEAVRRAYDGTLKPVFYKGEKCGSIREYSDTLLIFLLKARNWEKFGDRVRNELTGRGGGPIQNVNMSPNEFREIARQLLDEV
ncbi:terminase [Cupriavidus alkaliphilus]|uniref:terminase n=1 Tax=Cupriavidus alkaliphilus TaxID=942866 RepID=UPI00160E9CD2|nr:terminase [Cupriavidus alkaliphilus]MBB2918320.1 ribosomal protein S14 [Cupriavidus alkaliphilus]